MRAAVAVLALASALSAANQVGLLLSGGSPWALLIAAINLQAMWILGRAAIQRRTPAWLFFAFPHWTLPDAATQKPSAQPR